MNTDSTRYFGGDATSVGVDANQEEVTYTGIARSTPPAQRPRRSGPWRFPWTTASCTLHRCRRHQVLLGWVVVGQVQFDMDAERPDPPRHLLAAAAGVVNGDLTTIFLNATRPVATDIRTEAAGIGDKLQFDIKVGPANMPLLLEQGHKVVVGIGDKVWDVSPWRTAGSTPSPSGRASPRATSVIWSVPSSTIRRSRPSPFGMHCLRRQ